MRERTTEADGDVRPSATARSWAVVRRGLAVLPSPRRTPFTFYYLGILALTTLLLRYGRPAAVHHLLRLSSTDAVNLQHHPVQVLLLSALWLPDAHWLIYATLFSIVIAPLERRIGTGWTILIFASGHVIATLATELPVLVAVRVHWLPRVDGHLIDIGVSYGLFAVAGALSILLPARVRRRVLGVLNTAIIAIYLGMDPTSVDAIVTTAGHLLSLYIGLLGWLPWLRRRGLVGSLPLPQWLSWLSWRRGAVAAPAVAPSGTPGITG